MRSPGRHAVAAGAHRLAVRLAALVVEQAAGAQVRRVLALEII